MDKNIKKIALIILISIFALVSIITVTFIYNIRPVNSKSEKDIKFEIKTGSSKYEIVNALKKNNLIRSEFFTKIVLKFNDKEIYAGTYILSKDMSTLEILDILESGKSLENETVTMTFIEGKKCSTYFKQISEVFDINIEDIESKVKDKDYLNKLIEKYWFLDSNILNEDIYVSLEGYLYPDTYEFKKNSTIEEMIEKFLDNMDSKLSLYKNDIKIGEYNIHEYLTLASIVELEGVNDSDRKNVAGVFYNRLSSGITLGSDMTTYYAVGKEVSEELYQSELNSCNGYNTRGTCVKGLPVGPICNPGLSSITASITPEDNDYLYFVSDSEKKTYFSKTEKEHADTVAKLKSEGKWYTY